LKGIKMALEEAAVLDLIKSMVRVEAKVDMVLSNQEDRHEDDIEEGDDLEDDPMNWRNLLGADSGLVISGGGLNGAMADSSYDSSTGTYDGLPRTGAYNGGY
jgi:hypothetical protein